MKNVSLAKASFVKFRAQSVDFLEVSNPRALLEVSLRKFTCLTVGDTICIPHSGRKFYLDVREVQPNGAASIIETDCNVDFEEPLGYKDSKYGQYEREHKERADAKSRSGSIDVSSSSSTAAGGTFGGEVKVRALQKARAEPTAAEVAAANAFKPFSGNAKRIDGKLPSSVQDAKLAGVASSSPSTNGSQQQAKAEAKCDSSTTDTAAATAAPVYQSRIGDKYSKKKTAVSAFTGTAYKLNP